MIRWVCFSRSYVALPPKNICVSEHIHLSQLCISKKISFRRHISANKRRTVDRAVKLLTSQTAVGITNRSRVVNVSILYGCSKRDIRMMSLKSRLIFDLVRFLECFCRPMKTMKMKKKVYWWVFKCWRVGRAERGGVNWSHDTLLVSTLTWKLVTTLAVSEQGGESSCLAVLRLYHNSNWPFSSAKNR